MSQKDLPLLIVIVIISATVSLFASRALFTSASNQQQMIDVVPAISASLPSPDSTYFNSGSIDPTQLIQVGNNNNSNPFNGSTTQ